MPKVCVELSEDEMKKFEKAAKDMGVEPEELLKMVVADLIEGESGTEDVKERLKGMGYF